MHRGVVALSAGLALTVLAACGSTPPPPRPQAQNAQAHLPADRRASAAPLLAGVFANIDHKGSARSSVHGKLGLVGDLTAEGVVRYTGQAADVAVTGHTQMSPAQRLEPAEVSVVDTIGYLKSPLLRPEPGKPWLVVNPTGTDFAAKLLSPALEQLRDSIDPRKAFGSVIQATKIDSSAPDTVDGERTTRYDIRVLTREAAKTAHDPQQRDRLRRAADAGQSELGYQLWVDEAGLPARFAVAQAVAQAGQVSLDSTYHDWGIAADIQPPPPELVGVFQDMPIPQAQQPPR